MWNFCSCTDASLAMFAFDLYDTDASGRIETAEIENMLKEVYGREGYEKNQHAAKLMLEEWETSNPPKPKMPTISEDDAAPVQLEA